MDGRAVSKVDHKTVEKFIIFGTLEPAYGFYIFSDILSKFVKPAHLPYRYIRTEVCVCVRAMVRYPVCRMYKIHVIIILSTQLQFIYHFVSIIYAKHTDVD